MAYCRELDDSQWKEVKLINSYALFMGYLSMAIKGLGFLILTWTTVVLLGGFVSMLQKKDFWCLTFITLVQTAGIFDVYLNEKLTHIAKSFMALVGGAFYGVFDGVDDWEELSLLRLLLAFVVLVVQVLVFLMLLGPLAAMYVSGLLISTGISIWRLKHHDYGSNSDSEANLKPAMDTLYYLALLQGALFCYRFLFARTKKGLVAGVVEHRYSKDIDADKVMLTYLRETRIGCEKDPSFAKGRNLITHAVDLLGSKSRDDCLNGVEMLYTAIRIAETRLKRARVKYMARKQWEYMTEKRWEEMEKRWEEMEVIGLRVEGEKYMSEKRREQMEVIGLRVEREKYWAEKRWEQLIGLHMMMKNLIMSSSSSPVLHKLLQTLDPRGAFDRESRNQGATIVSHLALDIHLEQFPQAIQYICSLIGSFEEYRLMEPYNRDRLRHKYDRDWNAQASRLPSPGNDANNLREHWRSSAGYSGWASSIVTHILQQFGLDWAGCGPGGRTLSSATEAYEKLVLTGLCILRKLATHENNCKIMSHAQGLLPRIMAPLTSDMIHQFNGGAWSISVVEESLKVMHLLISSPGETSAKLRREISGNKEAIGTMERILSCDCCSSKLQKRAMVTLIVLYMDTESREAYVKMLVDIFADDNKDRSIRKLAGEALAKLSIQEGRNISIILQASGDVVHTLTKILLLDDAENNICRIRAAEILEQMCIHHTQEDESLCGLKKHMTDTMHKVLAQILGCGLPKDETDGHAEANQVEFQENENDIENQFDNPQDNARDESSSPPYPENNEEKGAVEAVEVEVEMDESDNEEKGDVEAAAVEVEAEMEVDELDNDEEEEFHAPLLSLFLTVCDIFISADEDLAHPFGAVDAISKLKEMVEANSDPTVRCLRLMKLTCKMVISIMKHRCSYQKEELESLTEALSSASESMSLLDISMVFVSEDAGAETTMKPVRSLVSLVKEAKESVDIYFKAQEFKNVEPFISTDG